MTQEENTRCFHHLQFKLACYEKKGNEFQNFFADIMEKYDGSFIRVIPHGKDGDMKCDGYSQNSATLYQCYAPMTWKKVKLFTLLNRKLKLTLKVLKNFGSQINLNG